ncbi:MAG: hypothetical protein R2857_11880 [Vampirovibrionales bacterium]
MGDGIRINTGGGIPISKPASAMVKTTARTAAAHQKEAGSRARPCWAMADGEEWVVGAVIDMGQ